MAGLTDIQIAINDSLVSAIDTAFAFPFDQAYQIVSVGVNGGDYVHIQGTPSGNNSAKFLYPTFQSFDRALKYDADIETWVKSPITFTDQLLDLYSKLQYRDSHDAVEIAEKNSQIYANAIDKFWSDDEFNFVDYFGPDSRLWYEMFPQGTEGLRRVDTMFKPFFDIDSGKPNQLIFHLKDDLTDSSSAKKYAAIEAAYVWSIQTALDTGPSALTRRGRDTLSLIAKRNNIEIKTYDSLDDEDKAVITTDFVQLFSTGTRNYRDHFNPNFRRNSPNPFWALWPSYVSLVTNRNLGQTAGEARLVLRGNYEAAVSNLLDWYTYDPNFVIEKPGQFSEVYLPVDQYEQVCETEYDEHFEDFMTTCRQELIESEDDQVPSSFKDVIPRLGPYTLQANTVEGLMLDAQSQSSDVGVNINVSMEKSSGNVLSFSSGNQRREVTTKNDSSDASLMGFFVCAAYASESSSFSERDDVTLFSEYAANTETQSFSVEYNNSFSQSWRPTTSGPGMWLAESVIAGMASNSNTDENKSQNYVLPYIGLNTWPGGVGFNSSREAYRFLKNGFAMIDSIIYSASPSVSMNIQNTSSESSNWQQSSFSQSQFNNSIAIGFGDWFFGNSGNSSAEGQGMSRFNSTEISERNTSGDFRITNSGLGSINGSAEEGPNPYYGYAGLEIGYRVKVIANPNPFIVVKESAEPMSRKFSDVSSGSEMALVNKRKDSKLDLPYVKTNQSTTDLGPGDNFIIGGKTGNSITAGKGDDVVFALKGSDFIRGGSGDDFLSAGSGRNRLRGGAGSDTFEINSDDFFSRGMNLRETTMNKIYDFSVAENDVLWFTGYWDNSSIVAKNNYVVVDGFRVAKLIGLSSQEVQSAIDTAVFVDFS